MNRVLNKAGWITAAVLALLLIAALGGVVFGGPLDPPGPPGSTLPQVEPRTPISSLPFTISQPGSYFLTGNLSLASGSGIGVTASNVTIDLNGFTLSGTSNSVAINTGIGSDHLVVRNGTFTGWIVAIQGGAGSNGLANSRFEDLQIRATQLAINAGGASNAIERVTVDGDSGNGFFLGASATVEDCQLVRLAGGTNEGGIVTGSQSTVRGCSVTNFPYGIQVGANSRVTSCDVWSPGVTGIYAAGSQTTIADNTITSAGSDAIVIQDTSQVDGNHLYSAPIGVAVFSNNNTVIRNDMRGVTSPIQEFGAPGSDYPAQGPASTMSSPLGNIIN